MTQQRRPKKTERTKEVQEARAVTNVIRAVVSQVHSSVDNKKKEVCAINNNSESQTLQRCLRHFTPLFFTCYAPWGSTLG